MPKRKQLHMATRQELDEYLDAARDRQLIVHESRMRSVFCENLNPYQYVLSDGSRCVVCTIIEGSIEP